MKYVIGLTALLMASVSFGQQQGEIPPAPIYSHGKVKATISKSTIVRNGDRYDTVEENICTKEIDINVWDIRQPQGKWGTSDITCKTKVHGHETEVVAFFQAAVGMFNTHGTTERTPMFSFMGALYGGNLQSTQSKIPAQFSFTTLSKDLNTKSVLNVVGPSQIVTCDGSGDSSNTPSQNPPQNCTITNPEAISATIEFIGE